MGKRRMSVAPTSCSWSILVLASFRFTRAWTATHVSSSRVLTVGERLPGVICKKEREEGGEEGRDEKHTHQSMRSRNFSYTYTYRHAISFSFLFSPSTYRKGLGQAVACDIVGDHHVLCGGDVPFNALEDEADQVLMLRVGVGNEHCLGDHHLRHHVQPCSFHCGACLDEIHHCICQAQATGSFHGTRDGADLCVCVCVVVCLCAVYISKDALNKK